MQFLYFSEVSRQLHIALQVCCHNPADAHGSHYSVPNIIKILSAVLELLRQSKQTDVHSNSGCKLIKTLTFAVRARLFAARPTVRIPKRYVLGLELQEGQAPLAFFISALPHQNGGVGALQYDRLRVTMSGRVTLHLGVGDVTTGWKL